MSLIVHIIYFDSNNCYGSGRADVAENVMPCNERITMTMPSLDLAPDFKSQGHGLGDMLI